jgi:hypothetical protein
MSMLTKLTRKVAGAKSPSELASMRSERAREIDAIDREGRAAGLPEDEIARLKQLTFREASDAMKMGMKTHFQDQMAKYGKSIGTGIATVGAAIATVQPVVGAIVTVAGTGVAATGAAQAAKEAEKDARALELEALRKGLPDAVRLASEGKEIPQPPADDRSADPSRPPGGQNPDEPGTGAGAGKETPEAQHLPAETPQGIAPTFMQRIALWWAGVKAGIAARKKG